MSMVEPPCTVGFGGVIFASGRSVDRAFRLFRRNVWWFALEGLDLPRSERSERHRLAMQWVSTQDSTHWLRAAYAASVRKQEVR
jgi:hypothetical protein